MQILKEPSERSAQAILNRLKAELTAGRRVLWLISGGSNISLQVRIMAGLQDETSLPLKNLVVLPMDERFGPVGHADSNMEQLRQAGFNLGTAKVIDVLDRNQPMFETVTYYSNIAADELANAQVIIGQFGMGDDGHVAGIKPDSPATSPGSATIIGYNWSDYERMTMSAEVLQQISVAYLPAYGINKKEALERLGRSDEPFDQLPAKLLYDIPETYIYTDQDL